MPRDYLQNHPEFSDLIRIVAEEKGIDPALVEKDHWIMHCLYGLQKLDFIFQLKGGTSLSKGHGIISRFSEDIDILIEPPPERDRPKSEQDGSHQDTETPHYGSWARHPMPYCARPPKCHQSRSTGPIPSPSCVTTTTSMSC
jgi:hypothetical protein